MKPAKPQRNFRICCLYDEIVPVAQLRPHPKNNYRRHPVQQIELLAKNIREHGWRWPVIVSKRSHCVVAGHARMKAAIRLGNVPVPVSYQSFESDEKEIAFLLADNRIAELAGVDQAEVRNLLAGLDGKLDLDLTGYTAADFKAMLEKGGDRTRPEVEFSEDLMLEHNYLVLYFDNPLDWQHAVERFGLKKVKDLIPRKAQPTGIGRVVNGAKFIAEFVR